jgi:hypothetical protein
VVWVVEDFANLLRHAMLWHGRQEVEKALVIAVSVDVAGLVDARHVRQDVRRHTDTLSSMVVEYLVEPWSFASWVLICLYEMRSLSG